MLSMIILILLLVLGGCTSAVKVTRLDADAEIDLSGNWNDTDIQIVAESLVGSSMKTNWIDQFRLRNGHNPVVIVGTILNRSSEHIDTAIIAKRFEMALINTGKVDMVADIAMRDELHDERESQQYFASEETAAALGKEIGADFILQGAVRTVVDQVSGKAVRTYYVSAELIDIETSRKIWVGEEMVRKFIQQSKYTW
ncbi:MAG TPA: penicillin-binding protein activator LpoB [Sphaerochaeta sp.]|nr:MAG: penicillin-binding protein activator LpoB [Spirochaetes bacterium GWC2_52_13]HCG63289.1 penicillin-binding protein activator LpoB [Sphaerochaeta sp.]HCS36628.1 penicillin-binding protein activator LpoB [Sphaerochaeta sp.]